MHNCFGKFEFILDKFRKLDVAKIFTENISFPEFIHLKIIKLFSSKFDTDCVHVSTLVENLGVTAQAISKCLRVLEGKNYIERSANKSDRRITEVRLTNEGDRVLELAQSDINDVMSDVFSEFTKDELYTFELLTNKFLGLYSDAIDRRIAR